MSGSFHDIATQEERATIASRAKRKLRSEVALILSFGFLCFCIMFFVLHTHTITPLGLRLNILPTTLMFPLAFATSALLAVAHCVYWAPKLRAAKTRAVEISQADEASRRSAIEAKLSVLEKAGQ